MVLNGLAPGLHLLLDLTYAVYGYPTLLNPSPTYLHKMFCNQYEMLRRPEAVGDDV